jgi:DnaJ-class molecular chaperone
MRTVEFCPKCKGTGLLFTGETTIPCNRCTGDGQIETGLVDDTELRVDVTKCLRRLKKIMDHLGLNDD